MKPKEIGCPSCGATHDVHNPGVMMIVCEYCGNSVYWDEEQLRDAGKQSILPEGFSRLFRGATGRLLSKRFVVLGRVRYSFGKGFWDEWFLEFHDGTTGWLFEDNHEFALEREVSGEKLPPFSKFEVGAKFRARKKEFVVEEVGEAECLGVEGDLPKAVLTGEKYPYVDASSPDGKHTLSIEFDDETPTVFYGSYIKYAMMTLDDEGKDW